MARAVEHIFVDVQPYGWLAPRQAALQVDGDASHGEPWINFDDGAQAKTGIPWITKHEGIDSSGAGEAFGSHFSPAIEGALAQLVHPHRIKLAEKILGQRLGVRIRKSKRPA